jgi:hypothetical protein
VALDLALARLKEAGLVRERTSQRTGSTHVLAVVRDLTRLELVTETVGQGGKSGRLTAGSCRVTSTLNRRSSLLFSQKSNVCG